MQSCTCSMRDSLVIFAMIRKWSNTGEHLYCFAKEFSTMNSDLKHVSVLKLGKCMSQKNSIFLLYFRGHCQPQPHEVLFCCF